MDTSTRFVPVRGVAARSSVYVRWVALGLTCVVLALPNNLTAQVVAINPRGGLWNTCIFGRYCAAVWNPTGDGRGVALCGDSRVSFEWPPPLPITTTGAAYLVDSRAGNDIHLVRSPRSRISGEFGMAVAGLHDVNNDGRGDFLVGAYFEGTVDCFSGADASLIYTLRPSNPNSRAFGFSVAVVSDVNADGIEDITVGAPFESGERGKVYVFSGATGIELYSIPPPHPLSGAGFGDTVAGVPDVDGDGFGDILVGAAFYIFSYDIPGNRGRAYLFSGTTGALIRGIESPIQPPWSFGSTVAGIQDIDGDGRGDYLITAKDQRMPDASHRGAVFIYSGATGTLLRTLASPTTQGTIYFGQGLTGTDDLDGDGIPDYIIGAPYDTLPGFPHTAGAVYVYSGRNGAIIRTLGSPQPLIDPNDGDGSFGWSVASVPDASGDFRPEILVAARFDCVPPCIRGQGQPPGRFYVFNSCAADFNYDGALNSQDFFDFLSAFFQGWPGGDQNRDGAINSTDFFEFLDLFFKGCSVS